MDEVLLHQSYFYQFDMMLYGALFNFFASAKMKIFF